MVPALFNVPPAEKNRDVNDHLGTLNNIFLETEDSSLPVFTSLKNAISYLDTKFQSAHSTLGTSIDNLKNFVVGLAGDSTDFQTSLDNRATVLATAQTDFNDALASEPFLTKRLELIAGREAINAQVNLENSNLVGIEDYAKTLADNFAYSSVADDPQLRKLITNTAQNENWITYFRDYTKNKENLNPIYDLGEDSDRSFVINEVLVAKGLPDVLNSNDLIAVANKAKLDSRIDTKGFDFLPIEEVIKQCCVQLNLHTYGTVFQQSKRLLSNLNQRDRDIVAEELDLNQDSGTIS